jgi:phosphopantothenoylcysteine synthetase/decarboxylase
MRILVTAGNTLVPIDRVRGITNIFSGRTGAGIALEACRRGHTVTLLTSHPQAAAERNVSNPEDLLTVKSFRTFQDLEALLAEEVTGGCFEAVIHCAAVSDYQAAGIYAPTPGTQFRTDSGRWEGEEMPSLVDRSAAKVKSDEPELWLRLVRTPKLIDRVRSPWSFHGILVKFKLEVDIDDQRLLEVAEQSRRQSDADLLVANTLEGMTKWAYLGPMNGRYVRLNRADLPSRLLEAVERLKGGRSHG